MAQRMDAHVSTNLISIIFALLVFSVRSSEIIHPTDSQFSYEKGSQDGPEKWGTLQKDWGLCSKGTKQSPIDIVKDKARTKAELGPLDHKYKPTVATIKNHAHDYVISFKGGGGILTIQGKEYILQQAHWHVPSDHTVDGVCFDAEMHMVHESSDKKKAVISIMFRVHGGNSSKLLNELAPYFKRLAGKEDAEETVETPMDLTAWIAEDSGYYRYQGSLTTPPCTEGVIWTIMSKVADASQEQVDLLKSVAKSPEANARPVQKINDRVVYYYEGKFPPNRGGNGVGSGRV